MVRNILVGVALVGSLVGSGGCAKDPPPVAAARQFGAAVASGDHAALIELIDKRWVERLDEAAERATDQIGGRRPIGPEEMFQVVDVDPRFEVRSAVLLDRSDDKAVVRLVGVDGTHYVLTLVLQDERWRVEVPLPPTP